jgi:glycosyltransferase involved in cell wall biosynthesis
MAEQINLLQVFNQYLESGGEEVWVNNLQALAGDVFGVAELRFHSGAWVGTGAPSRLTQAFKAWNNPESRERLRQAVARERPKALLFHNLIPVGSFGLYEEAGRIGLPVLQYVHNFRPFSPSGTLWLRGRVNDAALRGNVWPEVLGRAWESSFLKTLVLAYHQRRLLRSGHLEAVKCWIAVSEFMRRKFVEAGLPPERVTALRHCWQAGPERGGAASEGKHYLFLGRLVPEKGTQVLLDAWKILERRLGAACPQLVIAGAGFEEARLHAAAAHLNKVICVGFVAGETKDRLLATCRALIAPSIWWEPLGLIVYEAYDYSRPVLAAASGGLTETVVPGETGFLHSAGSAEALANDVEQMEALGSDGRREMGAAGRKWLLAHASPAEWRDRFFSILRRVA